MPEGQWSFLQRPGPRRQVKITVSDESYLALRLIGAMLGMSPTTVAGCFVEQRTDEFVAAHVDELSETLGKEREARKRRSASEPTPDGRSVQ